MPFVMTLQPIPRSPAMRSISGASRFMKNSPRLQKLYWLAQGALSSSISRKNSMLRSAGPAVS